MRRNLLVILMLVLAISLTACGSPAEEEPIETPDTENVEGVDEDSPEEAGEEEGADLGEESEVKEDDEEAELVEDSEETNTDEEDTHTWPADFMPSVPEFQGKVFKFTEKQNDVHVYIGFEDVTHEEAVSYVEELKEAGFTKDSNGYSSSGTVNYKANDTSGNFVKFHWSQNGFAGVDMIKK